MPDYLKLPTTTKGLVRVVIETPRGAAAKMAYDPAIQAFAYVRPLPAAMTYPYDWGFIPSTLGEDGDPLDGLVIHQAATAPGIVIKCDLLGALRVKQKDKGGAALRNDRYIFSPRNEDAEHEPVAADHVPEHLRREIEQFFRSSVLGTGKAIRFKGWQDAAEARKSIKRGMKAFAARK
ncbi:inorganic diphosphatase [Mesorhizobium neociceri]|uniref:inorganic diphosphatase n=1 Tax=Mesorhizobium neociceri TaxID=1307853 RepID=A0A838B3I6_9HYPH|nr:inorganic diphosphatase [Mesorhizobium neociceri]MBA1140637.1 inorganic diphosphatase [Mesorhizobium neociceri]